MDKLELQRIGERIICNGINDSMTSISDMTEEILALAQQQFLNRALAIILKEPERISSSQSTRQGYVSAVNDMRRNLTEEFE